jgi:nicotinamidase-related amidase
MSRSALIVADDSILIVIDVQPAFVAKLPPQAGPPLVNRICWLIGVARWLNVSLVVTAENIAELGGVAPEIERALPPDTRIHDKLIFGLAADPAILAAVEASGRRTAVLIGLETDVCVAQSALGLLDRGYRVVAVADATGSPGSAHADGLERIRGAGGIVLGVKSLFYEWLRTVEQTRRFGVECAGMLGEPDGVTL